ncbi:glutamate 5-kinase [Ignatzschineria larvae DSM 13226]|uniref:Glutamate 5-kinase n=1 Tax=Ignatzschineria larvae DSM 13226 TaxID=1111732 RepID=A0ABZ3C2E7_9GAMM|nr:glutamate 5-kinase [Ignatzschineria larvae]
MKGVEKQVWVVKIGSAMITNDGRGVDEARIHHWCEQVAKLHEKGIQVVLVSSGAVAEGMKLLNWHERPQFLSELQAAASVGQSSLIRAWSRGFMPFNLNVGQILLTHEDAADRQRYLNIKNTINTLLQYDAVPVINENDTISFSEIKFGDNDTLGALVANLIEADNYIILTDQEGVYEADPRKNPEAKMIHEADAHDERLLGMVTSEGGKFGTGGMYTKITASHIAATSGTNTYIVKGDRPNALLDIANSAKVGTKLKADGSVIAAKKRWMLAQKQIKGHLVIDDGAVKAMLEDGKSLLPIGVIAVDGNFDRGDVVVCIDQKGREIGRGLSNYHALEIENILQTPSSEIVDKLGYIITDELIHRNNWVETQ